MPLRRMSTNRTFSYFARARQTERVLEGDHLGGLYHYDSLCILECPALIPTDLCFHTASSGSLEGLQAIFDSSQDGLVSLQDWKPHAVKGGPKAFKNQGESGVTIPEHCFRLVNSLNCHTY